MSGNANYHFEEAEKLREEKRNKILWRRAMQASGAKMDPIKWLSDNFTITFKKS